MDQGILLPATDELTLSVYCDSDWASCPMTRRFIMGYLAKLGYALISCKTKKQPIISRYTTKVDIE